MRSYKCEFCAYQVGPIKPTPPECAECRCGNHFQIKTKMHPLDIQAWDKHQRLDRFIDKTVGVPVVLWQREVLHQALECHRLGGRTLRVYPARCNGRSQERALVDLFLALFFDSEKEHERCITENNNHTSIEVT